MNAQSCSVTLHIPSTCHIDQYTNKLVCLMMGLRQQATALLWERTELVFHAKKGGPHQRISFHCVCSTSIYHTSPITPFTLYPLCEMFIMLHPTPLSSVNYEPFLSFYFTVVHCSLALCPAQNHIRVRFKKQGHCLRIGETTLAPNSFIKLEFNDSFTYSERPV